MKKNYGTNKTKSSIHKNYEIMHAIDLILIYV